VPCTSSGSLVRPSSLSRWGSTLSTRSSCAIASLSGSDPFSLHLDGQLHLLSVSWPRCLLLEENISNYRIRCCPFNNVRSRRRPTLQRRSLVVWVLKVVPSCTHAPVLRSCACPWHPRLSCPNDPVDVHRVAHVSYRLLPHLSGPPRLHLHQQWPEIPARSRTQVAPSQPNV
jgi:hypothetical protein